jgi:pimeloyl-ACP methyl ester carboxylesterase
VGTRIALVVIGTALVATAAVIAARYHSDLDSARVRVAGSSMAATPCGRIEYSDRGKGPTVLVVHGAGGGFDQGEDIGEPLLESGWRVVAMSRFGYLRTAHPADASAEAQADAHACLLDALEIPHAAVVGVSAGAPSSMQLAIRHPERVSALVLIVPAAYTPRPGGAPSVKTPPRTEFLFNTALKSDFLFWAASHVSRGTVTRSILGTSPDVVANASPAEQERVRHIIDAIMPLSARQEGLMNDARVVSTLGRYELERVRAPTLAISVADDGYGTYEGARYTAAKVPNGRFVSYARGGHVWVDHQAEVVETVTQFLRSNR